MEQNPHNSILIVDDEDPFRLSVSMTLNTVGINHVLDCGDSREVLDILQKNLVSVVLLDLTMPYITGEELVPVISKEYPQLPIIVISAINQLEVAVGCMKNGAYDYILKPVDKERLVTSIKHALELSEIRQENLRLKEHVLSDSLKHPEVFLPIVTKSKKMHAIFKYLEAISASSLPVLITGETGVGKEQIARSVHALSGRKGNFIPVNAGGLDGTLFSDTLFGHRKGAFSGAERDRKGMIEEAEGGTLFLDEIGDLSLESQIKLLRLLQEGKYFMLGSDVEKISRARVVVATHQDLNSLQKSQEFRSDLYFRLQYHQIQLPPLRERREDIPLLLEFFLEKAAQDLKKPVPALPQEALILLENYSFPGNIRELESMVYDALSRHEKGVLSLSSFKDRIKDRNLASQPTGAPAESDMPGLNEISFGAQLPPLKKAENMLIEEALRRANGNQTLAADILGLSRQALNNRLQRQKR